MRRSGTAAFLVALLLVPRPAHAWFGWLDNLSGPGKFHGWQYEFRVACFGPEAPDVRLEQALDRARSIFKAVTIDDLIVDAARRATAQTALDDVIAELDRYQRVMPVFQTSDIVKARDLLSGYRTTLQNALRPRIVVTPERPREAPTRDGTITDSGNDALKGVQTTLDAVPLEPGQRAIAAMASTAIFVSFCGTKTERRSSLEVGFYPWRADGDTRFASGQEIHLDTAMVFYSYRVFTNPKFDFVDTAFGGGMYWFSSEGFESFHGIILQPIRGDFHVPTYWASYPWTGMNGNALKRLAAVPSFRWGAMIFPAGFNPGVFGPPSVERFGSHLVQTWAFFLNVQPLLPRRTP